MTQSIDKQIGAFPAIEAKFHFFQVGWEMLGADSMPCSHDATLEQRESGFHCVGVNVSHDIDAGTVVNFLVIRPLSLPHGRFVRGGVISENNLYVLGDILADVISECSALRISGMEETKIAVAFADAYHYFFVVHSADAALALIPSADVSNIHLYFSVEHRLIGLRHGVPDAMAEVPRCLVAHADCALNLAGGHSLFRFAEKMSGQKPLAKWQMRIVEYGAGSDGELIVTVFAIEELFRGFKLDHWPLAAQAFHAIRPAETHKKLAALIFGREERIDIN